MPKIHTAAEADTASPDAESDTPCAAVEADSP
jgi:hypothetical protein